MSTEKGPASKTSTSTSASMTSVRKLQCLQPFTRLVNGGMENFFGRLGRWIGIYPWWTILMSVSLVLVSVGGLFFWTEENDGIKLWTTYDSPTRFNSRWVKDHFSDVRYESLIISADNILRPDVLLALAEMDNAVRHLATADGDRWVDVCARMGKSLKVSKRRRRSAEVAPSNGSLVDYDYDADENAADIDLSKFDFSEFDFELGERERHLMDMLSLPDTCLFRNILHVWNNDIERIRALDQEQIIVDVNSAINEGRNSSETESLMFLLSDIERDANDNVIRVGATMMTWLLDNTESRAGTFDDWEDLFIEQTQNSNMTIPADVRLFSLASSSFLDGISETVRANMPLLGFGFALIILYLSFAMGRFNWIEQRLVLSVVGVSVVGVAILSSYGLCFYLGIFYGPVHPTIPFLLLGIGVDDMFVIVQALDNLSEEEKGHSIPERMSLALKHAGVSITVTSVTDVAAFAIGTSTTVPALRSFCVSAMVGIVILFILEVTFFVALTVLDERRRESRRAFLCLGARDATWKPSAFSQRQFLKMFFERIYAPILLKTPVKVLVLLITGTLVGVNIWGILHLEQNFDPNWYVRENSYVSEYFNAMKRYFPENGERASIYTGEIDYVRERDELNRMTEMLRTNPFVQSNSVLFWYEDFQIWLNRTKQVEFPNTDGEFKELMQEYLFSPVGRHYLTDVKVSGSLVDLEGNFTITGSRLGFNHLSLKDASVKNTALDSIRNLSQQIDFGEGANPPFPVVYTYIYVEWESNKVISSELVRNLCLTMAAVITVTLILISDLVTVFWVFTCIAFTLIDLLGLMYYWGLTIEIASSIIVILAAGLAIDYSAHIGHTFTTVHGSKSTRAKVTLARMGPAVWNGGFSTFLAFILLCNTDSHIFTTFFKLFFGVVVFGLFHGLAYLPIVLSCFGPEDTLEQTDDSSSNSDDFSTSPTSTASSAMTPIKDKLSVSVMALDNPAFISHHQIYRYPDLLETGSLDAMKGQRAQHASLPSYPQQLEVPYIPQPDYTPLPARRSLVSTRHKASSPDSIRDPEAIKSSSEFRAQDWNTALMKQLSLEAQKRQNELVCKEANVELDRFESEIDSYLKASSTAEATPPSPEAATPPIKTDRDQISLESGYMSSYPVDAQRSSAIL